MSQATHKKKQLQLIFFPKHRPLDLPEGYNVTRYRGKDDISIWIELCKNGLAPEDAGRDFFDACITNFPYIDSIQMYTENGEKDIVIYAEK